MDRADVDAEPGRLAVTLLQSPDLALHLADPRGQSTIQVAPPATDASSWWVSALDNAVIVGDGQEAWLRMYDDDGWSEPYLLPNHVTQAQLIPRS